MPTEKPVRPRLRVGIAAGVRGFSGSGHTAAATAPAPRPAPTAAPPTAVAPRFRNSRRSCCFAMACLLSPTGPLVLPAALSAQPAEPAAVSMAAVAGAGPIAAAELFAHAPPSELALLPQVVTTPKAPNPSVSKITVRAVRNRDHAGFLLEWRDATQNARTAIDGFGDMVAIAFPVRKPDEPMPAPFMGNPNGRVQILQWRADWQTDLERGPPTVAELYPNAYTADFYHEDHLPPAEAAKYRGAAGAGCVPSWMEVAVSFGIVAAGFGLFALAVKYLPVFSAPLGPTPDRPAGARRPLSILRPRVT